jgi:glucuronoxylan 4-O-methyltransferase
MVKAKQCQWSFVMTDDFTFVERWVRALVKINPGQMTFDEYMYIIKLVREHYPCDVLVFGVGNDNLLWYLTNAEGQTIFLEDDLALIAQIRKDYPVLAKQVHRVVYTTTIEEHAMCVDEDFLDLDLFDVPKGDWRVIIVNGPKGYEPSHPGRMQSIYTAWALSNDTHVVIHDCDREVEAHHADFWFDDAEFVKTAGKLRHYHVRKG